MVPTPALLQSPAPAADAARHPLSAFVRHALRTPSAPALAGAGGEVGYGELLAMAADAAAQCERQGLGPDARVAVVGPKTPETIALTLACLLTERPVLLAPQADRPAVLRGIAERAGVERVLAAEPQPGADVVCPSRGWTAGAPAPAPRAGDIALMLTTSGSTGAPKVVPLAPDAIGLGERPVRHRARHARAQLLRAAFRPVVARAVDDAHVRRLRRARRPGGRRPARPPARPRQPP